MAMWKCLVIVAGIWTGIAIGASSVFAQGGPSNLTYTPRPTISPYVNLFNDPGRFANY